MSAPQYHTMARPARTGCWQIGGRPGLSIYMKKRPRWLTRFLCRVLLEWEWIDAEKGGAA